MVEDWQGFPKKCHKFERAAFLINLNEADRKKGLYPYPVYMYRKIQGVCFLDVHFPFIWV